MGALKWCVVAILLGLGGFRKIIIVLVWLGSQVFHLQYMIALHKSPKT